MKRKYRLIRSKITEGFDTQKLFAEELGIDNSLVSRILSGERRISELDARIWVKVLKEEGVEIDPKILKPITK